MVKFVATTTFIAASLLCGLAFGNETVLLDFTSPNCPPCRHMEPMIRGLESAGYPIQKIDTTRDPSLAARYGVTRVPCFVMLAGGQEVDRVEGATSQQRLETMFQRAHQALTRQAPVVRDQSPDTVPPGSLAANPWSGVNGTHSSQPPLGSPAMDSPAPTSFGPGGTAAVTTEPAPAAPYDPPMTSLIAVSVRLRVEESDGHSFGTGTIIDTRSGEALIITCGHLFRESGLQAKLSVEVFESTAAGVRPVGQYVGKVISFDLDRDVGLVRIRPDRQLPVASVATVGSVVDRGDRVASVGCSHGADPTVLATRLTSLGLNQSPPNFQAAGAPVEGRSGGGLFNEQGQLIGVCFGADYEGNEGFYASLDSVHNELDRIGLSEIYNRPSTGATPENSLAAVPPADVPAVVRGQAPAQPLPTLSSMANTAIAVDPQAASGARPNNLNVAEQAALEEILSRAATSEVICIIRPKEAGGQSEVITLDDVSPEFIEALAARRRAAGSPGVQ